MQKSVSRVAFMDHADGRRWPACPEPFYGEGPALNSLALRSVEGVFVKGLLRAALLRRVTPAELTAGGSGEAMVMLVAGQLCFGRFRDRNFLEWTDLDHSDKPVIGVGDVKF